MPDLRYALPVRILPELPHSLIRPIAYTVEDGITDAPDVVAFTADLVEEWMVQDPPGVDVYISDDLVRIVLGWPGRGLGRVVYRVWGYSFADTAYLAERIA